MKKETVIGTTIAAIGTMAAIGKGIIDGMKSAPDLRTQKLKKEFLKAFEKVSKENITEGAEFNSALNSLYAYRYRMLRIEHTEIRFNGIQRLVCLNYWDKDNEKLNPYNNDILIRLCERTDSMLVGAKAGLSEKAISKISESEYMNCKEDEAIAKIESAFFDEAMASSSDSTKEMLKASKKYLLDEIGYSRMELRIVMKRLRKTVDEKIENVKQETKK